MANFYVTSNKIKIEFTPWCDGSIGKFKLTDLNITEQLGGALPKGTAILSGIKSDDHFKLMNEKRVGKLILTDMLEEKGTGLVRTIPIYINNLWRSVDRQIVMEFTCIPDHAFFDKRKIQSWKEAKIDDVIGALYPWDKEIRTKTDITTSLDFYQNNETDHAFLCKLLFGYKNKTVFGFSMEGLILKDIMGEKNSRGKVEDTETNHFHLDVEASDWRPLSTPDSNHHSASDIYYPVINLWEDSEALYSVHDYSNYEPVNIREIVKRSTFLTVRKDYEILHMNQSYNCQFCAGGGYGTLEVESKRDFPAYKLGDVIKVVRGQDERLKELNKPKIFYIVSSNTLQLSIPGSSRVGYSWKSTLVALNQNNEGRTLGLEDYKPEDDPQYGKVAE